ncbi:DUF3429 domain-containing protein [Rhizobium sp. AG855]|uniref:DUF3429 domain-containing protein n=1 Tax=Rhizobium sp. AG855 TaxID=2183898 RepID=UPI000E7481D5|nr:DUF3429 domain-containing protein [Rhizobium sp. AG855]RKE83528.1 uncharacterized protein DUF3429 [Rhizobium sp. AG855]
MYREKPLSSLLAYLGALPFWAIAIAPFAGIDAAMAQSAFIAYGTGIACFMAGTIWSQAQISPAKSSGLLLFSNAAALIAIAALLLHHALLVPALLLQAGTFLLLLLADHRMFRKGDQPAWYFALRRNVTALVLLAYGLAIMGA